MTPAPSTPSAAPRPPRLVSLDVFRGLTVMAMLLVNDPGDWNAVYWPLDHADWNGWTPTDLVFPVFLFIVGVTTWLSLGRRRAQGAGRRELAGQVLRRAGIIVALGLFLNWLPGLTLGPLAGHDDLLARMGDRLLHVRLPGVLQRIGLVYAAAGFLALSSGWRVQLGLLVVLLLGYWALLMAVPVPDTGAVGRAAIADRAHTLAAFIDRAAFDWGPWGNHLWGQALTWDPEGILSTFPAIGTAILGLLAGRWIGTVERPLSRRILWLLGVGVVGILLGLAWGLVLPINKKLWTSSYVLLTGGFAAAILAALMWVIDLEGRTGWTGPFRVFGVNPILAYVGSELAEILLYEVWTVDVQGERVDVVNWFDHTVLGAVLAPKDASLAFAVLFVLAWWLILRAFYVRGVVLKV